MKWISYESGTAPPGAGYHQPVSAVMGERNADGGRSEKLSISNLITVQQDATYSVYYISVGSSTCFGC